MNEAFTRACYVVSLTAAALLLAACRTPSGAVQPEREEEIHFVEITMTVGRILKVNEEQRYVVLDCASLPSKGEVAIVYDGDQAVGRLLITGPLRTPFMVADITDGNAATGNTVKVVRKRRATAAELEANR